MKPDTLAGALVRLQHAIARSRAAETLAPFRPCASSPRPGVEAVLATFAALSIEQAQFSAMERSVLVAMGLGPLMDAAWWAALVTALNRSALSNELAARLEDVCARLQLVSSVFPALAALAAVPNHQAETEAEAGGLMLDVAGQDGMPPSLIRIASVLEAMNQLWWVAEELTGQRGMLHLRATVPGPTTSLHFDGLDEPMHELRLLLVSVWEQAHRLPNIPPEQYASMVPGTLPVMDRIGRSGRADAVRVRNAVESGVKRLLEAGCRLRNEPADVRFGAIPAVSQAELIGPHSLSDEDISHLAAVIAEERSQLQQADPPRRMWQGAGTTRTR